MATLGRTAQPKRPPREGRTATAEDVRAALRVRYAAPAFAIFDEVGNATGGRCSRHADCVAMGLWPSRGLDIHGIEIKVNRSDWLKELRQPSKADTIAQYCDRWWVAVGSDAIVKAGELPPNWGLLVLRGDRLVCTVEAPKLEPVALARPFVAALLRRAEESINGIRNKSFYEGVQKGRTEGPEEHMQALQAVERSRDRYKKAIETFEEKAGLKIDSWNGGNIGEAVNKLMNARRLYSPDAAQQLERVATSLENTAKQLRDEQAAIAAEQKLALELHEEVTRA